MALNFGTFERQQVTLSKRALVVDDDAVEVDGEVVGVVERKKLAEPLVVEP